MLQKSKKQLVRCDSCNTVWSIETWIAVERQEDAEIVQMIEDGIFFTRFCPTCGKEYKHITPTVYFDKNAKTMICFVDDCVMISQTEWLLNTLIDELGEKRDNIKLRVTTSINEFQEKIILHHNGLDDRVVELIKLRALDVVREEGYTHDFDDARCSVNEDTMDLQIDLCGNNPRHILLDRKWYDLLASKMIKVLNSEPTPLEINADWAIDFSFKHNI